MYKLIAIDLDGTLLNSYGEVTKENKNAILNAKQKGIEVVLASGRAIMSVKSLADELGCNNYIICGNGALTYDMKKEEIIYNKFLEKNKVLEIIKVCEENSIYYNLYTTETILAKSLNYNLLFYNQENATKPESKKTKITIVDNIYEYVKQNDKEKYLKITICDSDKIIFGSIIRKLRMIKNIDVLDVAHMSRKIIKDGTDEILVGYYYTEISNVNVDKWEALKHLAQKLSIKEEEIIAIGDNINDKKMVEGAGVGVIMGNSAPYIKEIADMVVADNNNSGVAQAINNLI